MKQGICVAGNAIVDILYPIERYPGKSELTTITEGIERASGGALCNVAMDLAQLDPSLKLETIGRVGDDEEGDFLISSMAKYPAISLSGIKREGKTSFTIVMCESSTNTRTFFQYRGANANLCPEDFDLKNLDTKILHIGYILLLDTLDEADEKYGTKMARVLHNAQKEGIKTSIDVVSEASDRFTALVTPALKYTDYCIINELEAQQAIGVKLRDDNGQLLKENMPKALSKLLALGVSTWAVIHAPEGGYGMDKSGHFAQRDSLHLPPGYIKGTVGAGDAFCAGILFAAYHGQTLEAAIELGIAAAACSLSTKGATEGLRSAQQAMQFYQDTRQSEPEDTDG